MELTKEIWTQSDYDEFAEYLKTLADEKYKKFSDSLVPVSYTHLVFHICPPTQCKIWCAFSRTPNKLAVI